MRIDTVQLDNFQNYDTEQVQFPDGVTLIRGENGAGKSTLLRAIFAGLFPSKMKKQIDISSLDQLVRKGEDEAVLQLTFIVGEETYTVTWTIEVDYDDDGEIDGGSTKSCRLESTAFEDPIDGVNDVVAEIERVIGMDEESFVNSVYVQQEELVRLTSSDADERAQILDRLLGLKEVEDYIERMEKARPSASAVRDEAENKQEEIRDQLADYEELSELKTKKREVSSKISEKEAELEEKQEKLEEKQSQLDTTQEKLDSHSDLEEEKKEKEEKIESRESKLDTLRQEVEDLSEQVSEWTDKKEELESQIEDIQDNTEHDISDLENAKSALSQVRDELSETKETLSAEKNTYKNTKKELSRLEDELSEVESELSSVTTELTDTKDELASETEDISDLRDELETAEAELEEAVREHIGGEVEVTREDVRSNLERLAQKREKYARDGEDRLLVETQNEFEHGIKSLLPQFDAVDELKTEIRVSEARVSRFENKVSELESEKDSFESDINDLESRISEKEDEVAEQKQTVSDIKDELDGIQQRESELETVVTIYNEINELENEMKNARSKIGSKNERITDIKEHLEGLKEERERIEEELSDADLDELKEIKSRLTEFIDQLETTVSDLKTEIKELRDKRTQIESNIETVQNLKDRIDSLEDRRKWAENLYREVNDTIDAYEEAKSKLRRENVASLNKYVNELFDELYQNKSFDKVRIHEDYSMELVRTDQEVIEPEISSGGEGVILNIALRAGVYKLIAERETDGGESLPPFILDEPTTFLDSEHIAELDNMIRKMQDWDVGQVIVVSHEESLIDSADNEIVVEKNNKDISSAETNPTQDE